MNNAPPPSQVDPPVVNPPGLRLQVARRKISAAPGSSILIPIQLYYQGTDDALVKLSIVGIPATWIVKDLPAIPLSAGTGKEINLNVQLPPGPQAEPGSYPITLQAVDENNLTNNTQTEMLLIVAELHSAGRIGALTESTNSSVSPGGSVTNSLTVQNLGSDEDTFNISFEGVPVEWIALPAASLTLPAGEQIPVTYSISPPRSPQTRAGRDVFTLRISSQAAPEEVLEIPITLTVAAYTEFRGRLEPSLADEEKTVQVILDNLGNHPETFTISWESPEDRLQFFSLEADAPPAGQSTTSSQQPTTGTQLHLANGQSVAYEFFTRARTHPLFGGESSAPYTARILTAANQALALDGAIRTPALFPVWVIPILVGICLILFCLTSAAIYNYRVRGTAANQTATAQAVVGIWLTQTALASYQLPTPTLLNIAGTPTTIPVQTPSPTPGAQDSDGDGLADNQEIQIGTNPNAKDTDGDGLTDGQEVFQSKTNPLNADTDTDGLSDGVEVLQFHTNPLSADSDGDRLVDGQEVQIGTNPLNPDTDGDGLVDGAENASCPNYFNPDSDVDGIRDGSDLDPCNPTNPSMTATAAAGQPIPPTASIPTPVPTSGNPPPIILGLVAIQSNRAGYPQIFSINSIAGTTTQLTNTNATNTTPAWSPNMSKIAFTSNITGNNEIYVMNADGSGLVNVTNNPADDIYPVWSPDNSYIAFTSNRTGNQDIFKMLANGTEVVDLSNNPAQDLQPSWNYVGGMLFPSMLIVFTSTRDGNQEIYGMSTNGSDQTNLTRNPANDFAPSISPNRSNIAFTSDRDGNQEIYVMSTNGGSQTNITRSPYQDQLPSCGPNGTQLAFVSNRTGNQDIYIVNLDGSGLFNFTNNPAEDTYPSWE